MLEHFKIFLMTSHLVLYQFPQKLGLWHSILIGQWWPMPVEGPSCTDENPLLIENEEEPTERIGTYI